MGARRMPAAPKGRARHAWGILSLTQRSDHTIDHFCLNPCSRILSTTFGPRRSLSLLPYIKEIRLTGRIPTPCITPGRRRLLRPLRFRLLYEILLVSEVGFYVVCFRGGG